MKKYFLTIFLFVIAGLLLFFFIKDNFVNEKQKEENLEVYSDKNKTQNLEKVSNKTVDLSNAYSKKDKELMRAECEKLLDKYLPLYFNYPDENNKKIFEYHNKDSQYLNNSKETFWKSFSNFVSKYQGHEVAYFYISNTNTPLVDAGVFVHANMKGSNLKNDDYDVFAAFTLIKTKDGWKVEDFVPSKIFKKNTGYVKKSDLDESFLDLNGEYVDSFDTTSLSEENTADENGKKSYGDIIEDEEDETVKEEKKKDSEKPELVGEPDSNDTEIHTLPELN